VWYLSGNSINRLEVDESHMMKRVQMPVECDVRRLVDRRSKSIEFCMTKRVQHPWRVLITPGHEPTSPSVVSITVAHAVWTCIVGKLAKHAYY